MIEIAGGILLALIAIILVIAFLPLILRIVFVAALLVFAGMACGVLFALWEAVGPIGFFATLAFLVTLPFLYWLGEDKARWDKFWKFR